MVLQAGRDAVVAVHAVGSTRRVEWPVRIGVPPALAGHYQERRAYLELAEALTAGRVAVVVGARAGVDERVVVSGLGGVGKSQLAARHAWQMWPDAGVDVAVWVSAVSRDAVVMTFAEAASRVLVEQDPAVASRAPERAARLFREWLASTDRRWLVILDDVQDPADLRGLEPPPGPGGQVVITTRLRATALTRGRRLIELDVFSEVEARAYLADALAGHASDVVPEQLNGLARDLGRLPLALGQAAAYIADQPLLTVTAYRALLADRQRILADLIPPAGALPEHEVTIAATWSLSIERADRLGTDSRDATAGPARLLLEIACLLDPNGVPLEVFTNHVVREYLASQTGREIGQDGATDGLTALHRFSLITLNPARPARVVRMHALVQRAVRDTVPTDRQQALARTAADALHSVWPAIDTLDPELAQALRSCTDSLHTHAASRLWTDGMHPLLDRAGRSLGDTGQVSAATAYWRALLDRALAYLGPDHPDVLNGRHNLANARGMVGQSPQAVVELEELLADRLRILGADHPGTLDTRQSLARWRGHAGDPERAVAEFEALSADLPRVLGPDHPDALNTRGNLAHWRGHAGNPAQAASEYTALLDDMDRVLGPDHPDTLTTRGNLAHWRGRAGDPVRATAEFETLLADRLRVLGPDHPHTLVTRDSLARWTGKAGNPTKAVAQLELVLPRQLRNLGPDHPQTLAVRGRLAHWRGQAGYPAQAAADFETLFADTMRALGPDHPYTLITRDGLTHWRNLAGQERTEQGNP
ncbi:tetratricopeptide repeat protein [Actinosynnema sp. NPDC051121]